MINKIINGEKYLSVTSASEYIGVSKSYIYTLRKSGEIHYIKEGNFFFVPYNEVINLKRKLDELRTNYYTAKQVCSLLDVCRETVYRFCREKIFSDFQVVMNTFYVLKSDVDEYLQNANHLKKDNYTIDDIANLLEISHVSAERLVHKNRFPGKFIVKSKWFIPKKEVHAYQKTVKYNKNDYLTVLEARKQYGISKTAIINMALKSPNTKVLEDHYDSYLIYKKDIEDYISNNKYEKEHTFIDNVRKAYNYFIELSNEMGIEKYPYKKTIELYNSFVLSELNRSNLRNLKRLIYRFRPTLEYMVNHISKEIYLFNNKEFQLFLENENLSNYRALTFIQFFEYCRKEMEDECKFTIKPKRKIKYNPGEYRETIPEEIFMQYYVYVTDLDYNAKLAINDPKHAQLWVYIMMHLFEAWRAGDIVFGLPNINLDEINIFELDYFIENKMSKTKAQSVINQYYVHEFVVNKTGAINGFNVPDSLIIPLGTALVIAELHRRKNNKDSLLYLFRVRLPYNSDYKKFFRGNEDLANFGNLKASRTLLTLFYEYVTEDSDCQELAHELARKLRSHKLSKDKFYYNDTTGIYIQERNNESKAKNLSRHIFDRGVFGWLYYILLKVLTDDVDFRKLSLETKTELIVGLHNKQSPYQVEGLGKYLLAQQEKKMTLIEEIRSVPKTNLLDKFRRIYQGIMPSEIPEAQCFKYGDCPYKQTGRRNLCRQCKYLIPNKYFLISLKNDIYDLVDKINNLEAYQRAEKIKLRTLLFYDMNLLQEAFDEESGLGEETVDAFINREDLRMKFSTLK